MSDESVSSSAPVAPAPYAELISAPVLPTPGPRTTEFWIAVVVLITATILCALGKLSPEFWVAATGGISGLYSIGRGLAKQGTLLLAMCAMLLFAGCAGFGVTGSTAGSYQGVDYTVTTDGRTVITTAGSDGKTVTGTILLPAPASGTRK